MVGVKEIWMNTALYISSNLAGTLANAFATNTGLGQFAHLSNLMFHFSTRTPMTEIWYRPN